MQEIQCINRNPEYIAEMPYWVTRRNWGRGDQGITVPRVRLMYRS